MDYLEPSFELLLLLYFGFSILLINSTLFIPGKEFSSFDDISKKHFPIFKQFIAPNIIILVLQLIFIYKFEIMGVIFNPNVFEGVRLTKLSQYWYIWPTISYVLFPFSIFISRKGISIQPTSRFYLITLASFLNGLTQELLFRGIFLYILRKLSASELKCELVTSILFGLFRMNNFFFGRTFIIALGQSIFRMFFGHVQYTVLRLSGSLYLTIFSHLLWDWLLYISDYEDDHDHLKDKRKVKIYEKVIKDESKLKST